MSSTSLKDLSELLTRDISFDNDEETSSSLRLDTDQQLKTSEQSRTVISESFLKLFRPISMRRLIYSVLLLDHVPRESRRRASSSHVASFVQFVAINAKSFLTDDMANTLDKYPQKEWESVASKYYMIQPIPPSSMVQLDHIDDLFKLWIEHRNGKEQQQQQEEQSFF